MPDVTGATHPDVEAGVTVLLSRSACRQGDALPALIDADTIVDCFRQYSRPVRIFEPAVSQRETRAPR